MHAMSTLRVVACENNSVHVLTEAIPRTPGGNSVCWQGDFSFERCCSTTLSPRGDPTCFEGIYTFEVCCPNEEGAQL